jgi:GNAT superfamily N-acetyltransferase
MAAIRAREWGTDAFWADRIRRYLSGEHSPQEALSTRAAFVAVEVTDVLGFAAIHCTRRLGCDGELQWLNVIEERRGHGIAGRLLARSSAWFEQQDALRVCVNVDPANAAARGLYGRYGALPLNAYWMVWDDARAMGSHPVVDI